MSVFSSSSASSLSSNNHPRLPFHVRSLYPFFAENSAEVSFDRNEIINVIKIDHEEWWFGETKTGQKGLFPSNYVELYTATAVVPLSPAISKMSSTRSLPSSISSGNTHIARSSVTTKSGSINSQLSSSSPLSKPALITRPVIKPHMLSGFVGTSSRQSSSTSSIPETNKSSTRSASNVSIKIQQPESKTKPRVSPRFFGDWSYSMALIVAVHDVVLGGMAVLWHFHNVPVYNASFSIWAGIYTILFGLFSGVFEYVFFGNTRTSNKFPIRGLVYLIGSGVMFASIPTAYAGVYTIMVAIVNFISCFRHEVYSDKKNDKPVNNSTNPSKPQNNNNTKTLNTTASTSTTAINTTKTSADPAKQLLSESPTFAQSFSTYIQLLVQQNRLGILIFLFIYAFANIAEFVYMVYNWQNINLNLPPAQRLSDWAPWAKGFGAILDLNCSVIFLPVLRSVIRYLYNRSTSDQSLISRLLRFILFLIPIDLNLHFHKVIAQVIAFATFGHVFIHFINVALAFQQTVNKFDYSPFATGGLILLFMIILYSATAPKVKQGCFEIFWICHHSFIPFVILIIFHGKGGFGPNYWKYLLVPGTLYLIERILRMYRADQPVVVLSITLMGDVFAIEFSKSGVFEQSYKEGQYIFLQCPNISSVQWHPFTISSAPQENTVSVHIRVQGQNSWTTQVRDYFKSMGPQKTSFFSLDRHGAHGPIAGKLIGPDGKALCRIDGPHSAPTQHLGEYSAVMVIGAGIGATPLSSAIKSVIFHKWKYFIGNCYPDCAYFYWVCAHRDIDAFRWLIRIIKESQDEVIHMRLTNSENMKAKQFQMNIFITSVPKEQKPIDVIIDDEIGFWGVPNIANNLNKAHAEFDEMDLYKTMKYPKTSHIQMGDIHIWNGRPQWGPRFREISSLHPKGDIGVTYCGNPMIVKDLQAQVLKKNRKRAPNTGRFKIHIENF